MERGNSKNGAGNPKTIFAFLSRFFQTGPIVKLWRRSTCLFGAKDERFRYW